MELVRQPPKFFINQTVLAYMPNFDDGEVLFHGKILEIYKSNHPNGKPKTEYLVKFLNGSKRLEENCVCEDDLLHQKLRAWQLKMRGHKCRELKPREKIPYGVCKSTIMDKLCEMANCSKREQDERPHHYPRTCSSVSGVSLSVQVSPFEDVDEHVFTESSTSVDESVVINIGAGLWHCLNKDYELIVIHGANIRLPRKPNVIQILETCVKEFITKIAIDNGQVAVSKKAADELMKKINLLVEVADGIRIYFDHCLPTHLLYRREGAQYRILCNIGILKNLRKTVDYHLVKNYAKPAYDPKTGNVNARTRQPRKTSVPIDLVIPLERCPVPAGINSKHAYIMHLTYNWNLVPPQFTGYPSTVYGANHLARLFIMLPRYFEVIKMDNEKMKLVLELIDVFVTGLEKHPEWFVLEI